MPPKPVIEHREGKGSAPTLPMLRKAFETTQLGVTVTDLDGKILYTNRAEAEMHGYEVEELIGCDVRILAPPELWRPLSVAEVQELDSRHRETINRRRDGSTFPVQLLSDVVTDENGEPTAIVTTCEDLSERKRSQDERTRFMTAIEQSAEAILITDPQGQIEYVNPAFESITGYPRQEVTGQHWRFLKSEGQDESFYREINATLASGKVWQGRVTNRKKGGEDFEADGTISPVYDHVGELVNHVFAWRDATREVTLEEQLRQAQKMEAIGQLAGGIAHDFNNLLVVIQGHATFALESLPPDTPWHRNLMQVRKATKRAAALTRQLLAFSRRQVLQPVDLALNGVIHDLIKILRRLIGENLELRFQPTPELSIVHVDRGQIEQVLMNLCVNARDAISDNGEITIKTQAIELTDDFCESNLWARPGDFVELSVTDTGCGMDEATRHRIFEPFFTTKVAGEGTGLGLATVYGIIQQHEGLIQVSSRPGVGTAFKLYLPVAEQEPAAAVEDELPATEGGTETVLLAEDDDMVRDTVVTILRQAGYKVLAAENGLEAVRIFEAHGEEIALVFMDTVMPILGGEAARQEMLEIRSGVPFLFSTGYSPDSSQLPFPPDSHVPLVNKPYDHDELLRKVRELLDA